METGRPYLMPNKNNSIAFAGSSIHLFVNGFSFCTPSKTEFVPTPSGTDDFKTGLIDLLAFYPKETFDKTQIISYHQPSTFVPNAFFDKKLLPNYLRFQGKIPKDFNLSFDVLEDVNQVNIHAYPKKEFEIIHQQIPTANFYHFNTLLYREVSERSKSEDKEFQLFIHLQKGSVDLYLKQHSTIVFQNHFEIKNEDEFLYYTFFVVEQYELSSDQFEMLFFGEIPFFETYYHAIKQYHPSVHFEASKTCSILDLEQHPAPFFAQSFK